MSVLACMLNELLFYLARMVHAIVQGVETILLGIRQIVKLLGIVVAVGYNTHYGD